MKKAQFKPPKDLNKPTIKEFESMVEAHEPTWVWSRDYEERTRGESEKRLIDSARKSIGDDKAVVIWNKIMHRKVVPAMLHEFLWTVNRRAIKA